MLEPTLQDLIAECYRCGFDIKKDLKTDLYHFEGRLVPFHSVGFETPEEAAYACLEFYGC